MSDDYEGLKPLREKLKEYLAALRPDGNGGYLVPDTVQKVFKDAFAKAKSANERLYLFGPLDIERMAAVVRMAATVAPDSMPWWPVFNARVHAGDLEGVRKVHKLLSGTASNLKQDLSAAYTWSVDHYALGEIPAKHDARVVRQLLQWGADVNYDNGKWLEIGLRNAETAVIQVLIEFGGAPATIFRVMDDLLKNQKYDQAARIQEALARNTLYMKIDNETLLESKFIPAPDGGANFKALFNFRSRRVNEIYETQGADKRMTMTSVAFDDYDPAAIGFAKEKLEQLGGKPPDPLGKPVMAKPGLGLPR